MALPGDVYRELEDILGPENISEDLAVIDGYAFQNLAPRGVRAEDKFFLRPEAVVLPGSTEDVQAIIKLCNRRGIKSKAFSTGYGTHNVVGSEGVIMLDLRRMNRILEIDEKNMHIVVEPYVSFAQVQAEVQKRGLNSNIVGAGSSASFLASFTSMDGNNTQAISQGFSGRNLLGAEWVLPNGEILRLGSLGSGAGWFSGDGPGPSLRGIMRGYRGACGGLGVFTKCAGHLHPWSGPRTMEIKGVSPEYETEIPPLFEYHIIEFPTWEQYADAVYKIGEAGIAYALHKTGGPGSHGAIVTGNNNEYYERRQEGRLKVPRTSFAMVTAANSPEEHAYQVKTLDRILDETEGKITTVGEDPLMKNRDFINMIKACFIPRLAFRLTGTFTVDGFVGTESMDNCALGIKMDEVHRDKYAAKGIIMDDGTSNSWSTSFEGTHFALMECGHPFSATDEESLRGVQQMVNEGIETSIKKPFGIAWTALGTGALGATLSLIGPLCGNYHHWMRKIKKAFDPNTASDPSTYISAEEE
jgi:glycolate oxidase